LQEQHFLLSKVLNFLNTDRRSISTEAELLKAIYEESRVIKEELRRLSSRIELIEAGLTQEEEISEEEAKELDKLAEEAKKDGVPWEKLKAEERN
jgi:uncharacterized protein with PIN domain